MFEWECEIAEGKWVLDDESATIETNFLKGRYKFQIHEAMHHVSYIYDLLAMTFRDNFGSVTKVRRTQRNPGIDELTNSLGLAAPDSSVAIGGIQQGLSHGLVQTNASYVWERQMVTGEWLVDEESDIIEKNYQAGVMKFPLDDGVCGYDYDIGGPVPSFTDTFGCTTKLRRVGTKGTPEISPSLLGSVDCEQLCRENQMLRNELELLKAGVAQQQVESNQSPGF